VDLDPEEELRHPEQDSRREVDSPEFTERLPSYLRETTQEL